jgi:hypothetical protein
VKLRIGFIALFASQVFANTTVPPQDLPTQAYENHTYNLVCNDIKDDWNWMKVAPSFRTNGNQLNFQKVGQELFDEMMDFQKEGKVTRYLITIYPWGESKDLKLYEFQVTWTHRNRYYYCPLFFDK